MARAQIGRLVLTGSGLVESLVEAQNQRHVEHVDPVGRAVGTIVMIVPRPVGREHEIEILHCPRLAVDDGGELRVPLNDKAQRRN